MEKIIIPICLMFGVIYLQGTSGVYAQSEKGVFSILENSKKERPGLDRDANTLAVGAKVLQSFDKMYGDATNVIWSRDDRNKYRVYFKLKEKQYRAAFNRKGQLVYDISSYGEDLLPVEINLEVKATYFRKRIFGVTEVYAQGKTAYLITLDDMTSWMEIKVLDGEIREERVWLKSR